MPTSPGWMPRPRPYRVCVVKKKKKKKKKKNWTQPTAPDLSAEVPTAVGAGPVPNWGLKEDYNLEVIFTLGIFIFIFFLSLFILFPTTKVQLTSAEAKQKRKEPPDQGLAPLQSGKIN
jgi:hypothetical protein